MTDRSDDPSVALAESFLQEAVYRSRGDQAGATLMAAGDAPCGLGAKPSVVLDLSPRAEELFGALFAGREVDVDAIRARMGEWVRRQDALDRTRNHFLKDFRGAHGFDRRSYDDGTLEKFEAGLERINGEASAARRAAAEALLEAVA